MYVYLRLQGEEVSVEELVKPEYISKPNGSSLADLASLGEAYGYHAKAIAGLTVSSLNVVELPIVLNFGRYVDAGKPGHFVLLTEINELECEIVNPSSGIERISVSELAARWDGNALLLSKQPMKMSLLQRSQLLFAGKWLFVMLLLVLLSLRAIGATNSWAEASFGYRSTKRRPVRSFLLLAGSACLIGLAYETVGAGMLFSLSDGATLELEKRSGAFIARWTPSELDPRRSQVIVIDSRQTLDFNAGHINGALSIPPSSSAEYCQAAMSGVPKDKDVIVYCQSESCPYAEIVTRRLMSLGWRNIRILSGGWVAWERHIESK